MIKFLLILIVILRLICVIFLFLWQVAVSKQKQTKETLNKVTEQLNEAIAQQAKLECTIAILKQNREEADKKVGELYKGDSVNNALDILGAGK